MIYTKKKLISLGLLAFCVFVLFSVFCAAAIQTVYVMTLKYDTGNISIQNLLKTEGTFFPPVNQPTDGYNLSIISIDNKLLYSLSFDFGLEVHSEPDPSWFDKDGNQIVFPNETKIMLDKATVELMLPYFDDAALIEVRDSSRILKTSIKVNTNKYISTNDNCLQYSCSLTPKTCSASGNQTKTCIDSCTNKAVSQEIKCGTNSDASNAATTSNKTGLWHRIIAWFKSLFGMK